MTPLWSAMRDRRALRARVILPDPEYPIPSQTGRPAALEALWREYEADWPAREYPTRTAQQRGTLGRPTRVVHHVNGYEHPIEWACSPTRCA